MLRNDTIACRWNPRLCCTKSRSTIQWLWLHHHRSPFARHRHRHDAACDILLNGKSCSKKRFMAVDTMRFRCSCSCKWLQENRKCVDFCAVEDVVSFRIAFQFDWSLLGAVYDFGGILHRLVLTPECFCFRLRACLHVTCVLAVAMQGPAKWQVGLP